MWIIFDPVADSIVVGTPVQAGTVDPSGLVYTVAIAARHMVTCNMVAIYIATGDTEYTVVGILDPADFEDTPP